MSERVSCDLLITSAVVLDLTVPDGRVDGAIAVTGDRIVAVDTTSDPASRWASTRTLDAAGAYVVPGFVDAHIHLSAVLAAAQPYRATTEPSLFGGAGSTAGIGRALHGFLSMPVPPELVDTVVSPVLAALALAGTTTVIDAGSAGIDGIVAASRRLGVRVSVGPGLHDVLLADDGTLERVADADEVLDRTASWLDANRPGPADPFTPVVTVTEPTFCSEPLLAGLRDLLERFDASISFHSHETNEAVADHDAAHGRPALERLAEHGLLGPRCTLMHGGAVGDRDIELLATTDTRVNVNPLGNAMLGFGAAHERSIARCVDAGVRLVLGSDYTPSMVATGFDLVRAALMVTREVGGADNALTLEQALPMASTTTIAAGGAADLVIIDHDGPHHVGVDHPVPGVALRARPDDVRTVVVGGRIVVDERVLVTADLGELIARADEAFELVRRAA